MERAASLPTPRGGLALVLPRVAGWRAVALVVALSTVARALVAFARQTPTYLPDEYLYSELGRSISTTGRPLVRGELVPFPALLQPILTAPAWLLGDVAASYHAIQIANSVAMSLAAVPAYLLARRAGVAGGLALAAAVLAVVLPDLVYTGWILSEPFAYPLALTGALLAVRALERPSAGRQLAFLAVAGLAGFTRAQLLLLPVCFVVAVVLFGLRERALARAIAQQWIVAGIAALAAILFLAVGSHFGTYGDVLTLQGRAPLTDRVETQALALVYGSGWLVLPGAVLGLAAAFWRPRTRGELAFASFTAPLVVGLLAQASLWGDTGQMQERYLFYCVPLLGVAFTLHAGRGWPWWRAYAALSAVLFVLAATVPLAAYAVGSAKDHAAILFALARADSAFGLGGGALVFGAGAGLLAVAGALLARSRWATVGITTLVLVVPAAVATAATSYDLRHDTVVRNGYLPADRSWVDDAGLHDVALVYAGGASKEGLVQLFWNRSVNRIFLLPKAPQLDGYAAGQLEIAPDGTLELDGAPLDRPLLVDGGSAVVRLRGARQVAASQTYALWRPSGTPRLAFLARGYLPDGWLSTRGSLQVWRPHIAGRMTFTVRRATDEPAAVLTLKTPAGRRTYTVKPGTTRRVALSVCARGAWRGTWSVNQTVIDGSRLLGIRSTAPTWTPDSTACT